jgi:membrane protein implicated in regulation of membrane protease activity
MVGTSLAALIVLTLALGPAFGGAAIVIGRVSPLTPGLAFSWGCALGPLGLAVVAWWRWRRPSSTPPAMPF